MKASVPARNLAAFAKNILRPKQVFYYTRTDLTTDVPVRHVVAIERERPPEGGRSALS